MNNRVDAGDALQQRILPPPPPYGFSVNSILAASSSPSSLTGALTVSASPIGGSSSLSESSDPHPPGSAGAPFLQPPAFHPYLYRSVNDDLVNNVTGSPRQQYVVDRSTAAARQFWIHQHQVDNELGEDEVDDGGSRRRRPSSAELAVLQPVSVQCYADGGDVKGCTTETPEMADGKHGDGVVARVFGDASSSLATGCVIDDSRCDYRATSDVMGGLMADVDGVPGWTMMSSSGQLVRFYGHQQLDGGGHGGYMLDQCEYHVVPSKKYTAIKSSGLAEL